MRVFLGAFGQPGHAFPILALGSTLAARGHTVMVETWSRWRPDVEAAGMQFVAAQEFPVFPTMDSPVKPYEAVALATPGTREQIRAFGADVVVHDVLTLAPLLAAELEGVPAATLIPHLHPVAEPGHAPFAMGARPPRTALGRAAWRSLSRPVNLGLELGRRDLNAIRTGLGLPELDRLHGGISRDLALVATLPQLEYPRAWPAHVHVVGPLFWEPPSVPTDYPDGEGPRVLVAPSTAQDPLQRMLAAAIDGLAGEDVRLLASTNNRPLTRGVRIGPSTRLVNWLSYAETMRDADLVICHAGHGTLVRALTLGVPVLAIPHVGDMAENAARLDWAGAGVRLPWRLLSSTTLRWAARLALDPRQGYRARAAEMAAWASVHDGATHAAELVEGLARGSYTG